MISRHIEMEPLKINAWRKIAIGTWRTAKDPSVYSSIELDPRAALAYIDKIKQETGMKITITHFIGRALAEVMARHPDLNCILRWGRLYRRKSVDIFFQVNSGGGEDLSGMTVKEANLKSIAEIARLMQEKVKVIREKGDPDFKQMKGLFGLVPGMFVATLLNLSSLIMYTFNLWTPLLGVPRDPFGSLMLTSVGSLGLSSGFAPLVAYSRVPIVVALGVIKDTPVVRNGQVVAAPMLPMCVTFDHRLIDGAHGGKMMKTLNSIMENPEQELGRGY